MALITFLLYFTAFLISLPVLMFTAECFTSFLTRRRRISVNSESTHTSTIIIPAHNEALVIANTLENLCSIKTDLDRVIVVADNCSDDTAVIAKSYPVEVVERENKSQRGKGYALAKGFESAQSNRSDLVIVVDADCLLEEHTLTDLKHQTMLTSKPVQALYLIQNQHDAKLTSKISEFAFLVKNFVRTRALNQFAVSVPLLGTGMAFPWAVFAELDLASGEIVEDMKLGVDLAISGNRVGFLESSMVSSAFPTTDDAIASQKKRWEHGHMDVIQRFVPKLIVQSVRQKRWELALVALDLCIPPLSLLVIVVLGFFAASGFLYFLGFEELLAISATLAILISISVSLAWFLYARAILSFTELISVPFYLVEKLPMYIGFFKNRQKSWVKTDRK